MTWNIPEQEEKDVKPKMFEATKFGLPSGTTYLKIKMPEIFIPKKDKNGNTYYEGKILIFESVKK